MLLAVVAVLLTAGLAPAAGTGLTGVESSLVAEMNRARAVRGLAPLRVDPALQRAARAHSTFLARTGTFEHGNFNARLARFGVRASFAGENLAFGTGSQSSPRVLVGAWLKSPPHRANLLRTGFRRVGVGAVVGTVLGLDGATIVTADFTG